MTQVTIIGAGMVGLALANCLADAGIAVDLVEQNEPVLEFDTGSPGRVSALNPSSRDLLKSLDVWDQLRRDCVEPFSKIEAWTEAESGKIHFDAADSGKKYLAYVVENREIVRVLWQRALKHQLITVHIEDYDWHIGDDLIIGADGANSHVRTEAGIDFKERSYGQHAIVANVHSLKPHQNTAYQNFLKTGPLGVLPLYNPHLESIVWSVDDDYAEELMGMNESRFNIALSNALSMRLGKLTLQGERRLFPLIMRHAEQYVKPGVALVGDAAHTIHPLAGQGVNLGFKDVVALNDCLVTAHNKGLPLDALNILRRYERERRLDNCKMLAAMQVFRNNGNQLAFAFRVANKISILKNLFVENL
jgi:2-octaprenylphenol hydroxylase